MLNLALNLDSRPGSWVLVENKMSGIEWALGGSSLLRMKMPEPFQSPLSIRST